MTCEVRLRADAYIYLICAALTSIACFRGFVRLFVLSALGLGSAQGALSRGLAPPPRAGAPLPGVGIQAKRRPARPRRKVKLRETT